MSTLKQSTLFVIATLTYLPIACLLISGQTTSANAKDQSNNNPPTVKITAPANDSIYQWNTLVNYSIVVSDRGKSTKYQELPAKKVLLKTTYVPDLSHMPGNSGKPTISGSAGVQDIVASNCLGCHQFKSAAMGPSFAAISQRYPHTEATIDTLSRHIRDGSVGIWGQASMPSHSDLTEQQLHAISVWITGHAAEPDVNYYVGVEGTFQMNSPGKPSPNAGLILTASYTSQNAANATQPTLRGEDTIHIRGK